MKIAVAGDSVGAPLAKVLAEYLMEKEGLVVSEVSIPVEGAEKYYATLSDRVASGILDSTYDRAILCSEQELAFVLLPIKYPESALLRRTIPILLHVRLFRTTLKSSPWVRASLERN